tara:strand:+ start:7192 stop:8397 length:1206 start_codon:yes stop_codon:yes gene_type:complete
MNNFFIVFGSSSFLILRFLTSLLLARYFGAELFGVYVFLLTLSEVISRLFDFSLFHAGIFESRISNTKVSFSFYVILFNSIIFFPLILLLLTGISFLSFENNLNNILYENILFISFYISIKQISNAGIALRGIDNSLKLFSLMQFCNSLFPLAIISTLIYLESISINNIFQFLLFSEILFLLLFISKFLGNFSFDSQKIINLYKFGLKAHLGVFGKILIHNIDKIIISIFLPAQIVGFYSIAKSFTMLSIFLFNMFLIKFRNKLLKFSQDLKFLRRVTYKELVKNLILIFPIGIIFYFFSEQFITLLYGKEYIFSSNILRVIIWSNIFIFLPSIIWNYFYVLNKPNLVSLSTLIPGIIGSVSLYIFIKYLGVQGLYLGYYFSIILTFITTFLWFVLSRKKV